MKHIVRKTLLFAGLVSLVYRLFPQLQSALQYRKSLPVFEGITHPVGDTKKHSHSHKKKVPHKTAA